MNVIIQIDTIALTLRVIYVEEGNKNKLIKKAWCKKIRLRNQMHRSFLSVFHHHGIFSCSPRPRQRASFLTSSSSSARSPCSLHWASSFKHMSLPLLASKLWFVTWAPPSQMREVPQLPRDEVETNTKTFTDTSPEVSLNSLVVSPSMLWLAWHVRSWF